ncbi:MAG: PQQ-binding-like beta-propeller repeat protein [Candidatus Aminicenantes bacterium]|nr:PQQ-binding-like beta-propeller repeat protein [Candidatus Aminicenantes bacterium]
MARPPVRKRAGLPSLSVGLFLVVLFLADFISAQTLTLEQGGIIRGPRDRNQLALVFTADYYGEGAEYILSELRQRKLKASFFFTGNFLRQPEFRGWIEKMVEDGHYLGPHSDRHLLYCDWQDRQKTLVTKEEFMTDLANNYLELEKFGVSRDRARYFMPPYEWYNQEIAGWAAEVGVAVINFTPGLVTSSDYTTPDQPNYRSSEEILNQLLEYETRSPDGLNGFILLVHLGTAAERTDLFYFRLGELIEELTARGYALVRIDELLSAGRSEPEKHRERAVIQAAGKETAFSLAPVQSPDKPEEMRPSRLIADGTGSRQTAENINRPQTRKDEGGRGAVGQAPEESYLFSLTRGWVNFARGRVNHLVPYGDRLWWFYENNQPAYELIEVQSGEKKGSGLLEIKLEQKPVPGRAGFWLVSDGKLWGLSSSGIKAGTQVELAEPLAGAPAESGNRLLLPFKKSLEARSTETAELLWKQELPAEFSGPLIIYSSEVLVPCLSGRLLRCSLETGRKIDQHDFQDEFGTFLPAWGPKIYFSTTSGKVKCFDLSRKKICWEVNLGSQRVQHLLSDGRHLYLLTTGGIIYKLKQSAGDILWWQTVPGRACCRPAILKEELIIPSGQILYGLDLKTGRKTSETVLTFEIKTDLVRIGDWLLAGSHDYRQDLSLVYALKKEPRVIIRPSRESPQPAGRRIVFTALAPGLEKPRYAFYLRTPDGRDRLVRKASKNNTWTWLPVAPGQYLISVVASSGQLSKKSELRYNITSFAGE